MQPRVLSARISPITGVSSGTLALFLALTSGRLEGYSARSRNQHWGMMGPTTVAGSVWILIIQLFTKAFVSKHLK